MATQKKASTTPTRLYGQDEDIRRQGLAQQAALEGQTPADRVSPSPSGGRNALYSLRSEQHLRRQRDFDAVRKRGVARAHALVVLRMAPNHLPYSRFAFVVGKRVSRKAVVRNKIRRRIREVVRQDPIQPGWDLVFIARAQSAEADFQALRDAVWNVERRARIRRSEGG